MKRNFKALLIKAIENFDGKAKREILSSINKNLGKSNSIVVKDQDFWM